MRGKVARRLRRHAERETVAQRKETTRRFYQRLKKEHKRGMGS